MISAWRRLLPMLLVAWLMAACGTGLGPSSIEVDRSRLDEAIASRFPFKTRWLGLLDVSVSAPTIRLLPDTNRIATDAELTVDERISARQFKGALGFQSGLRFEPSDSTLRLSQVSVDRIALAGLSEALSPQTGRLGTVLAEQMLEGAVVYQLTDAQQEVLRRTGVRPGEIRVTSRGLIIALERPAP